MKAGTVPFTSARAASASIAKIVNLPASVLAVASVQVTKLVWVRNLHARIVPFGRSIIATCVMKDPFARSVFVGVNVAIAPSVGWKKCSNAAAGEQMIIGREEHGRTRAKWQHAAEFLERKRGYE